MIMGANETIRIFHTDLDLNAGEGTPWMKHRFRSSHYVTDQSIPIKNHSTL